MQPAREKEIEGEEDLFMLEGTGYIACEYYVLYARLDTWKMITWML